MHRLTSPAALAILLTLLVVSVPAQSSSSRYVNRTNATCGGHSPCYGTIQAAVNAALPGDTVVIQAGTYVEQVLIQGKNTTGGQTEASRIVIAADPTAPVGSVILLGAAAKCTNGYAIRLQQSKFVTVRGLVVTGAGGPAVELMGGNNQNQAIHLEGLRIVGNGSASCNGGITIARGNPDTLIVNSLIHGNGRHGVATIDAEGGPHYIVGNTIHGNAWNGVDVTRNHTAFLVNNAITGNGTAKGSTGGRFGVAREVSTPSNRGGIHLLNNVMCGNRLGEIDGPVLDATDTGNLTPTGTEGQGVSASPGCNGTTAYAQLSGPDGLPNTTDDDFTPASGSALVDHGMDPRTLGLGAAFTPLFEADYLGPAARPRAGRANEPARFDIGAVELATRDGQPPAVTILQPTADTYVRRTITLDAEATDTDSGVDTLTLALDGTVIDTFTNSSLDPTQPFEVTLGFDTSSVPDGTHTLVVTATDRAGNSASVGRAFVVDNAPPDTQITAGPSGTVAQTSATFTFTGTDNATPTGSLVFAWRVDGGAYSAFSGTTMVTLTDLGEGSHVFDVKARDLAGNEDVTPATRPFAIQRLTVAITDPVAGATLIPTTVLVRGSVDAHGTPVGVSVNGMPAAVEAGAFAVAVPVSMGAAVLTAVATTPSGETATSSVTVTVAADSTSPVITLRATPQSGAAPLVVGFSLTGAAGAASVELDLNGDGVADFIGPSLDGQTFTYSQPGVYIPAVTVVDALGNRQQARALVHVFDRAALDGALQTVWATLQGALRAADVDAASSVFAVPRRARYRDRFVVLNGAGALPLVGQELGGISMVDVKDGAVEYELLALRNGSLHSFHVLFVIDIDGLWRLWGF